MCIKNFKKTFVTFVATLVMMFALVACSIGATSTEATEARKNLKNAVDQIALEHIMDLNNVVDDIKLNGTLVQFDAKVTWESSDENHLKIEADGANYIAKVTRPQPSEENVQVTLTATISVEYTDTDGTTKSVSDEKSYTLTIIKSEPAETLTDAKAKAAAELAANGKTEYSTNFYATVTAVMKDGQQFFVTDGTTGIYVYIACEGIKVGDVVNVQGVFSTYYGTLQIAKDGGAVTVLEADAEGLYHDEFGNVLYTAEGPLKSLQGEEAYAQDITVSDLVNQDTADGCFGGQAATLYGKLVYEKYLANSYDNYFLIDPYTAERVLVYYKSFTKDDEALLAPYIGQYVTINVATYDQKNEDGMGIVKRVAIVAESVKAAEAPTMTDEEKLANLLAGLQLPDTVESEYTLSTEAAWEVVEGNATIENGVLKVTQTEKEQTVVVRATVTVGELSDTKEFTITVPSSKIEVLTPTQAAAGLQDAANDGLVLHVGGFVAEGSKLDKYGNFVLEDAQGGSVVIYGGFGKDSEGNYLFPSIQEQLGIEVGVYVVVKGKYTTNYNNVTGTEIVSVSVDATKAAAGLADAANDGLEVLVHGTIAEGSKLDKYGNFVLEDAQGGSVVIYGGFGKDAEGNYLFPSIQEQLGLAVGVKVVVRGTYTVNYKNITGSEILMAMAAGETPEPEEHVHTACPECGKCTAEDCPDAEAKCPGHGTETPTTGLEVGVAYTVSANNADGLLYYAGTITDGRFDGTYNASEAKYVYLEAATGGYYLYQLDAQSAKQYIVMADKSAGGSFTSDQASATVFEFNATLKTLVVADDNNNRAFGAGTASTYSNFSSYDSSQSGYNWGQYTKAEGGSETPEPEEHVHTACPECGKCTAEDCTGTAEEKCPGHEVEKTYLTIAEVKKATSGTVVALKGVVIAKGTESLLVQDATGAIMLYKTNLSAASVHEAVEIGQEVAAEGKYSPYNGLHEVANLTSLEIVGTSTAPAVKELTAIDDATIESLQCQIISIELTYVSGSVADKSNAVFTDANGAQVTVRGDAKWGTIATVELTAGDKVKVTAFVNWFKGAQLTNVSNYTYVEKLAQPEQPEVPTHEHTACEICQKCTAEDCPDAEAKCPGHEPELPVEPKTITFTLGADGTASHNDGSEMTSYTETVDGYTLSMTGATKVYKGARDAKGNSCLKFGTSKLVGTLTINVPEDVTSVVIYVAKYKANSTTVQVNGKTYTVSGASNDGVYDAITIDTTTTKTISFGTSGSTYRCMVNTIEFKVE